MIVQPCNLFVWVKCKCRKRPRIKVMSFWIRTRWIHEVGKPQFLKLLSLTRMEYDRTLSQSASGFWQHTQTLWMPSPPHFFCLAFLFYCKYSFWVFGSICSSSLKFRNYFLITKATREKTSRQVLREKSFPAWYRGSRSWQSRYVATFSRNKMAESLENKVKYGGFPRLIRTFMLLCVVH